MKKWVVAVLIVVLFAGTVANGFLYSRHVIIIQNHEASIASVQADLSRAEDRITSLTSTTQNVAGNVSDLSGSVRNLQTDVTDIKEGIDSLYGTMQTLTEDVSSLSSLVNNIQRSQSNSSSGLVADFAAAIDKVKPSVVIIETQKVTTVFPGRRVVQQSAGSGWVISSDGLIVTNNHVIADATSIKVTLADGRTFPSVAARADIANDLAVIKIDARNLPVATIGDSDKLQVGQPVAAIGNALGLGINMSGGWISRLNTSITFSDGSSLSGLIGTDAAINPGNSGGPLITINGEVVGITNAKLVQTGVEGIGYAISINNAMKTISSLTAGL
jgi:S1-C subfamily serine protease